MHDAGHTVGHVSVEWWDSGLEEWTSAGNLTLTTIEDPGTLNIASLLMDGFGDAPGGLMRTRLRAQAFNPQEEPYPVQLSYVRVLYEDV